MICHVLFYTHKLCCLNCITDVLPQTDHPGRVSPLSHWDAGLRLHPQYGSPVGGVRHSWDFRVGNH